MNEKLTITVSPTGETTVKVTGHAGPACKDLTKSIENALGETIHDEQTGEYRQSPERETHRVNQR